MLKTQWQNCFTSKEVLKSLKSLKNCWLESHSIGAEEGININSRMRYTKRESSELKISNPFENPPLGRSWTERGAIQVRYALALAAAVFLLNAITSLIMGLTLSPSGVNEIDTPGLWVLLAMDMVMTFIQLILAGFMLLFFLLGLLAFYNGRREFDEKHEANIKRALLAVAFAIGLAIISFSLQPSTSTSEYEFSGNHVTFYWSPETPVNGVQALAATLSGALLLVGVAGLSLALYSLIYGIASPKDKRNCRKAAVVAIAACTVSLLMYAIMNSGPFIDEGIGATGFQFASILTLIPMSVGALLFVASYKGVLEDVNHGIIVPKLPTIVTAPPTAAQFEAYGLTSAINVSSVLASAHPLVEEIVRVEQRIRLPMMVIVGGICAATIFLLEGLVAGLITLAGWFAILALTFWGFREYQTKYTTIEWGWWMQATTWRVLYWKTYLRNAQKHSYEVGHYQPYAVSDALHIVDDVGKYLEFKFVGVLFMSIILGCIAAVETMSTQESSYSIAIILISLGLFASIITADIVIWATINFRFRGVRKHMTRFKSGVENFWRMYG